MSPHLSTLAAVALLTLSCAATAPRPAATAARPVAPPSLDGRAAYPTELTDTRLRAFYADAERQRADRLPPLEGRSSTDARAVIADWVRARSAALRGLASASRALLDGLAPQDRLFVALVYARTLDDLRGQVVGLAAPDTLHGNAEAERAWRDALRDVTAPLAHEALTAWRRCAVEAPAAPASVRPWESVCAARAAELAATERAVARPQPTGSVVIPQECEGGEYTARSPDPEAPPPDEARPRETAVLYEGTLFEGPERERLADAVHAWMARDPSLRMVPRDEVQAALALQAERRWRADGPVCGQRPPVAALLAARHPNLVIASVDTWCGQFVDAPQGGAAPETRSLCTLTVHPRRAGTANRGGLPDDVGVDLEAPRGTVTHWIDAVSRMTVGGAHVSVFGALGTSSRRAEFRVLAYADDDPWLRIGSTLYGYARNEQAREALLGCATRSGGVGSYRIAWTISPTGEGAAVEATPITEPVDGSGAQVAACVAERLAQVRWPCTRSGAPARVEARLCIGWR